MRRSRAEEATDRGRRAADRRGQQLPDVGDLIGDVALTYDWCFDTRHAVAEDALAGVREPDGLERVAPDRRRSGARRRCRGPAGRPTTRRTTTTTRSCARRCCSGSPTKGEDAARRRRGSRSSATPRSSASSCRRSTASCVGGGSREGTAYGVSHARLCSTSTTSGTRRRARSCRRRRSTRASRCARSCIR